MLFKKPEIDIEKHIEMRVRRVFPISLEGALRASYEEAIRKLREATELERQAWQLATEKSILESRLGIWNWLGASLDTLARALTEGSYEDAKTIIEQIRSEVLRRHQEEQQLLERINRGESVLPTYSSSSPSPIRVYTTTSTTSSTTQSTSTPSTTTTRDLFSELESQAKKTGETYVVPASSVTPGASGYYVITPQGGYSTPFPPTTTTTTTKPSQPSYIPAFNPFQQSGFYNPYRTTAPQLTTTYQPLFAGTYTATTTYNPFR